jgi:hypothetical protein
MFDRDEGTRKHIKKARALDFEQCGPRRIIGG